MPACFFDACQELQIQTSTWYERIFSWVFYNSLDLVGRMFFHGMQRGRTGSFVVWVCSCIYCIPVTLFQLGRDYCLRNDLDTWDPAGKNLQHRNEHHWWLRAIDWFDEKKEQDLYLFLALIFGVVAMLAIAIPILLPEFIEEFWERRLRFRAKVVIRVKRQFRRARQPDIRVIRDNDGNIVSFQMYRAP